MLCSARHPRIKQIALSSWQKNPYISLLSLNFFFFLEREWVGGSITELFFCMLFIWNAFERHWHLGEKILWGYEITVEPFAGCSHMVMISASPEKNDSIKFHWFVLTKLHEIASICLAPSDNKHYRDRFLFFGEQIIWKHSSSPVYHCSNKQVLENTLSFFRIRCYWAADLTWWHIFFTISNFKWTILYLLLSGHRLSLYGLWENNKVLYISRRTFYFSPDGIAAVLCLNRCASHDKINVFLKGCV